MQTSIAERVKSIAPDCVLLVFDLYKEGVPDKRREDFAQECQRQSLMVRNDPQDADTLK